VYWIKFGQHALSVQVLIDIRRLGGIVAVNYRSPAEAVGFLILYDLAAARGPPRERTLFPVACRHAWGRARQMRPFCDKAEAKEKLSRSPG
jgi:hypothetical protein